jgi:hypothetical protein
MFKGTIPAEVRAMLSEVAKGWTNAQALAVACSGNFTIERVFADRFPLMGCDVTLYSCILGNFFSGQPFRLAIKPEYAETFDWLAPDLADPVNAVAAVMLLTTFTDSLDKHLQTKPNAYYARLVDGYRRAWPDMLEKTHARLAASPLHMKSFHAGDAVDWLPTLGPDIAVTSFPPFFVAGYQKMFAKIDELFDWDAPAYQEIFDDRRTAFLDSLMDRPYWAVGTSAPLPDLDGKLRGICKTSNRGVPIYLYANEGPRRIVMPRQNTEFVPAPRLSHGDEVGSRLWLAPLTMPQFSALRSQYLNAHIKPAPATEAYAVLVDNRLIGCYALQRGFQVHGASPDAIYMLSDFPVAPTDYSRLAKLVLIAALSKEAQLLAERVCKSRIRSLVTTAFSDNPVSMKYRGLFALTSRKEAPENSHNKFQLQYHAQIGQWSLSEGLTLWKKKHGSKRAPSE